MRRQDEGLKSMKKKYDVKNDLVPEPLPLNPIVRLKVREDLGWLGANVIDHTSVLLDRSVGLGHPLRRRTERRSNGSAGT